MLEHLKRKITISADRWNRYASHFTRMEIPPRTTLLTEGTVSKKLFVIEKGCLRAWFNNNGKDVTFQFFFENEVVASIESFRKNIPSPVSIETIEPCIVWWIGKKDLNRIMEEIKGVPALRDLFIDGIFERTFVYMKHFFSSIKDTPLERYQRLVRENSRLLKRVPQHYIASYLGITSVHLSRIKSKLKKEKRPA